MTGYNRTWRQALAGLMGEPSGWFLARGKRLAGETILIVDDNADVRVLLGERVLPSYGYRTLTAADGQEGLWQIRTQKPDLILLDLRLPDMTGLDVLHILSSEGYDAPIILITAYGSELIAAQALRLGVRDYIIKPFTLDEIVESVERALTEQRLRRERNALTDRLRCCTNLIRMLAEVERQGTVADAGAWQQVLRQVAARTPARFIRLWGQAAAGGLALEFAEGEFPPAPEGAPLEVQQALESGQLQVWNGPEEEAPLRLAVPIPTTRLPGTVLEVALPSGTPAREEDPLRPAFEALAGWLARMREQTDLHRQNQALRHFSQAVGTLTTDVVLTLDGEDTIVAATPTVEPLFDQPLEAVIGRPLQDWLRQVDTPYAEDLLQWYGGQKYRHKSTEPYALIFRDARGETCQAEVRVLSRREPGGGICVYLHFHDSTPLWRLEEETRRLRQALSTAEQHAGQGLLLTDLQGTVLAVNSTAGEILHTPPEEMTGRLLWELLNAVQGKETLPEQVARTYREGRGYTEVRLALPEGPDLVLGLGTLLLIQGAAAPYAIAVQVFPLHRFEGPPDERDLLGG